MPGKTSRPKKPGPYTHAQLLGFNIHTTPDQSDDCEITGCYLGASLLLKNKLISIVC